MRLHEAVEACVATGDPFTRTSWGTSKSMYCRVVENDDGCDIVEFVDGDEFIPHTEDLTATDWRLVTPRKLMISTDDYWDAVGRLQGVSLASVDKNNGWVGTLALARELGLEPKP